MENRESNYEKVFFQFQEWFVQSPQESISEKIGAKIDENNLVLPFFRRDMQDLQRYRRDKGRGVAGDSSDRKTDYYAPPAVLQKFCQNRE